MTASCASNMFALWLIYIDGDELGKQTRTQIQNPIFTLYWTEHVHIAQTTPFPLFLCRTGIEVWVRTRVRLWQCKCTIRKVVFQKRTERTLLTNRRAFVVLGGPDGRRVAQTHSIHHLVRGSWLPRDREPDEEFWAEDSGDRPSSPNTWHGLHPDTECSGYVRHPHPRVCTLITRHPHPQVYTIIKHPHPRVHTLIINGLHPDPE